MRPTAQRQKHWAPIIDQLYQHLEEHDRHVALLRSIDHNILRASKAPMEIFDTTIPELLELTGASHAHLCRKHASHLALTRSYSADLRGSVADVPKRTFPEAKMEQIQDGETLRSDEAEDLFSVCVNQQGSVIPARLNSKNELWGVLLLEFDRSNPKTVARRYILTVANQLQVAIENHNNRNQIQQYREIHSAFFNEALGEDECLRILFENTQGLFREHSGDLLFQILFRASDSDTASPGPKGGFGEEHDPPDERLRIRLSSNPEDVGAFVPRDSFCGMAIDRPEGHLLDNPRSSAYESIYKNFSDFHTQTELVVLIRRDKSSRAIGVVNIEASAVNAFTQEQVQSVIDLVEIVSPIIVAIRDRNALNNQSRTADHYALSSYLYNLSNLYAHKFASRIDAIKFELYNLKSSLDSPSESVSSRITKIAGDFGWIDSSLRELWDSLPVIAHDGKINIGELITEIYKEEKAIAERYLSIGDELQSMPRVRASRLLKEHIRNIIINAVRSIERKAEGADEHYQPSITITAKEHTISQRGGTENRGADQVAKLNQRVRLTIRDNGMGIPKENIQRVFIPGFSTTRTSGYGLPAARDYVQRQGGSLDIQSDEGDFCAVIIDLLVYPKMAQAAPEPLREQSIYES